MIVLALKRANGHMYLPWGGGLRAGAVKMTCGLSGPTVKFKAV